MIMYIVLAVAGVFALVLLIKLLWGNKKVALTSKPVLIASAVLVLVLGVGMLSNRIHPLAAVGTAILPFMKRALLMLPLLAQSLMIGNSLKGLFNRTRFQSFSDADNDDEGSEASTDELAMVLDHESGNISGRVLKGPHANKDLNELDDIEVAELYRSLKTEESKRLLEAYIARHRPDLGTQNHADGEQEAQSDDQMTVQRAADILGVEPTASRDKIVEAHRRLIQHLHPDQGGSSYLAAELNEARRVMLEHTGG